MGAVLKSANEQWRTAGEGTAAPQRYHGRDDFLKRGESIPEHITSLTAHYKFHLGWTRHDVRRNIAGPTARYRRVRCRRQNIARRHWCWRQSRTLFRVKEDGKRILLSSQFGHYLVVQSHHSYHYDTVGASEVRECQVESTRNVGTDVHLYRRNHFMSC